MRAKLTTETGETEHSIWKLVKVQPGWTVYSKGKVGHGKLPSAGWYHHRFLKIGDARAFISRLP